MFNCIINRNSQVQNFRYIVLENTSFDIALFIKVREHVLSLRTIVCCLAGGSSTFSKTYLG